MRPSGLFCFLFLVIGISVAQDTDSPVGPTYLMTSGSPLFAQTIATPSLSLEAPLPRIPSLPAVGPAVSNQSYTSNPELAHQADLFPIYYGYPRIAAVALTSTDLPRALPANFIDVGVTGVADAQSLRERGYGVSLGEAAAFWRTYPSHASRVITNRDVELASAKLPRGLASSLTNGGDTATTGAQTLQEHGYGVSVVEAASFWRTHTLHATRVITNRDIERLEAMTAE